MYLLHHVESWIYINHTSVHIYCLLALVTFTEHWQLNAVVHCIFTRPTLSVICLSSTLNLCFPPPPTPHLPLPSDPPPPPPHCYKFKVKVTHGIEIWQYDCFYYIFLTNLFFFFLLFFATKLNMMVCWSVLWKCWISVLCRDWFCGLTHERVCIYIIIIFYFIFCNRT